MNYNVVFTILIFKLSYFGQRELLLASICVLVTCSHHSLSIFLDFGLKRYYRLILFFPYHSPEISHLSKYLRLLLMENNIERPKLGSECALCYWAFAAFSP